MKYLFIGGPLDGSFLKVEEDKADYLINSVPQQLTFNNEEPICFKCWYHRKPLGETAIYVADTITADEAFDKLINCYNPEGRHQSTTT